MSAEVNPAATHYMPIFITPPGQTDILMVVTAVFLLVVVIAFGVLFLRLHSLPERMAHRGHKLQFEIVAVLGLISLFTHIHAFWIAALLLAFIELPDIPGWMGRIAHSVERIAGIKSDEIAAEPSRHEEPLDTMGGGGPVAASKKTPDKPVKEKDLAHA